MCDVGCEISDRAFDEFKDFYDFNDLNALNGLNDFNFAVRFELERLVEDD